MDSYVETMDSSARAYSKKLAELGNSREMFEINHLTNQLTLEVMVATIFGDRSFNLLAINGENKVFEALGKIRKLTLATINEPFQWSDSITKSII